MAGSPADLTSCPRCSGPFMAATDIGDGVHRCQQCGTFVCEGRARSRLCAFLRVDESLWSELLAQGGRGAPCPACTTTMALTNLKGVVVDGCARCGALLLDPGELRRLTGRDEGEASAPATIEHTAGGYRRQGEEASAPVGLGRVYLDAAEALRMFLADAPWVQIAQHRQYAEAFVGLEFGNRYAVRTPAGAGAITVADSALGAVARMFLGGLLRSRYRLTDPRDNPCLILDRSFEKLVLSRLDVALAEADEPGRRLGSVEKNLRVLSSRYELKDARGVVFATLTRPLTSLWQFRLATADGVEHGAIAKQWSGFSTEYFTDADDFGVDFGGHPWTLEQRAIIVAATLAIDLDHFERKGGGNRGLTDLLR